MKAAHNISLSMFLNSDSERAVFKARKIPMVIGSLAGLAVSLLHRFIPFSTNVTKALESSREQNPAQLIYDEQQLGTFES